MAEVTIPKEKMNYTIDLLITMVTDEIAEETGKDRKEILTDFLCSKTGKALYDEKGIVEIKSEQAFQKLMVRFMEKLSELDAKIETFAESELKPYLER